MIFPVLKKWKGKLVTLIGVIVFVLPQSAFAEECSIGPILLEVPFRDFDQTSSLGEYIAEVYQFIIAAVGIISVVMIMFSGIKWAAAAGNQTMIGDAKERIKEAFFGLAIALGSYTILILINPSLVIIPAICPTSLEFSQEYLTDWVVCSDGDSASCDDAPYCNYSSTTDNECTCDNIGSSEGSFYVCRPSQKNIVPLGGICKNDENCVAVEGVSCIGNDDKTIPGVCQATTEGKACEPGNEEQSCSPGESCVEQKRGSTSSGYVCLSDTSREEGQYCTEDSQCASNICEDRTLYECMNGTTGDICLGDNDNCAQGYECRSGACQERIEGSNCSTDADCQNTGNPDNHCVDTNLLNECYDGSEGDPCENDSQCKQTGTDRAPFCVDTWGGNECYDGSSGASCNDGGDCISGTCNDAGVTSVGTCS